MSHTCTKVTVRQRAIRNNRISLYLDYYPAVRNPETMQMSRREYLGIYIYAHPKNEMEREFNNDMLNKAEAIRCIRVQSLINEDIIRKSKNPEKPKRKVQNPAKIGENHNSKRLLKYKSHNIGITKKEHRKPSKIRCSFCI